MTSSFGEFVFQHRYGKKWISYSDLDIDVLNRALKKNQKTVTLPNKDAKKQIIVNFENMSQKNAVSNIEQRVRALIFIKDEFYSWMWMDDGDEYCSFKPHLVYFLEAAHQNKLRKVKFYDNGDYTIDMKKFKRIDEESNDLRDVVRQKVNIVLSMRIEEISHQNRTLLDQMRQNGSVKLLSDEQRIFGPSISSLGTPGKSKKRKSSILYNPDEVANMIPELTDAAVDKECPYSEEYEVYSAGNLFYNAVLSSTSIESNTNKYVVMQILKKDYEYFLWQRCGHIGYKAQTDLIKYGTKVGKAKAEFEDRFYEKTRNDFNDVLTFKQVSGKYNLLKMDLSSEQMEQEPTIVESKLPRAVQDLLSHIASRKMMNQMMEDMSYDLKQTPLGKLTVAQIRDGYSSLHKIADVISKGGKGKDLITACDEFYSKIPHNFGRKKPPIIQTQEDVEEKLEMLQALLNINIAVKIFNETVNISEHPLDKCYKSLECGLNPLDPFSKEYDVIQQYFFGSCGPTHTDYTMEIINVFECNKPTENISYANYDNKYLLWHGSRLTNWVGILKESLRIAPVEAPSTGAMFGKGLYFADCSTKSANYCCATQRQNIGLLLLCEVSLGNALNLFHSVENMPHYLPSGYESVIGNGIYVPAGFSSILESGVKVPVGPLVDEKGKISSLNYNEYVVYNTNQVKMKYLLLVKFNFS